MFLPNSRLAYSSDPKLIETVTEGMKHILQSCLQAGTVETVVITSRDFDNLYGGKILNYSHTPRIFFITKGQVVAKKSKIYAISNDPFLK